MSKTSLKIKRNIDIHSKRTVFIGNETGEYAKSQINKLPKVDMRRAWQVALGAIPSMGTVKGTETEVIKTYIAQIALGSIPTVVGSSEAFNPSNWKNGDINTLFANSLYGGGISGVHTGAAQAEVEPKNIVLGAVSYVGWVKDKNTNNFNIGIMERQNARKKQMEWKSMVVSLSTIKIQVFIVLLLYKN